jgi:hypothetical protein
MRNLIVLFVISLVLTNYSCSSRKKKSPAISQSIVATPTPTPTNAVNAPITPTSPVNPVNPTNPNPTTTPTPNVDDPSNTSTVQTPAAGSVPLNVRGVPVLPNVPVVPEAHVVLISGEVRPLLPQFITTNMSYLCRDITIAAYYTPCSSLYLCGSSCGYFMCRR